METLTHPIPPLFDENSEILILGSFPSAASREQAFFYGHPRNRFWQVLAAVFRDAVPETVPEKRAFLLRHRVALWDVIARCDIQGSADSSIRSVVPNDLGPILAAAPIRRIAVNGGTAARYYDRYLRPATGREALHLPSTSPANARMGLEDLTAAWREILL